MKGRVTGAMNPKFSSLINSPGMCARVLKIPKEGQNGGKGIVIDHAPLRMLSYTPFFALSFSGEHICPLVKNK